MKCVMVVCRVNQIVLTRVGSTHLPSTTRPTYQLCGKLVAEMAAVTPVLNTAQSPLIDGRWEEEVILHDKQSLTLS